MKCICVRILSKITRRLLIDKIASVFKAHFLYNTNAKYSLFINNRTVSYDKDANNNGKRAPYYTRRTRFRVQNSK